MEKKAQPEWDLIVVGGGPAGLSAAQYGSRANLRTLVIEELAPGGTVLLISDMENYPGFPKAIGGFEFSELMRQQTEQFGATIKSATATAIKKTRDVFTVETSDGSFSSWAVVLSTGAKHRHLDIPGEEEFSGRGVSYCATCDGPFFKNKKILVVGGGDAACDEASYLANLSDEITLIHRRDRFRAQKSLAKRVLGNPNIEVRFNHILERIMGDDRVRRVKLRPSDGKEAYEENFDAVFIFVGAIPQTALVPNLEKDKAGYIVTNQSMETAQPGLYTVGDVRSTPFRQVVVACGEGAISAHMAAAHIDAVKGESYGGAAQT